MKISPQRPMVWATLGLCWGIGLGYWLRLPFSMTCLIFMVVFVLNLTKLARHRTFLFLFLIWGSLGLVHIRAYQEKLFDDLSQKARWLSGKEVLVEGFVNSDPQQRQVRYGNKTDFILKVKKITWQEKDGYEHQIKIGGQVLVNIFRKQEVVYGDEVRILGRFHFPFEYGGKDKFSYKDYLKRQGVRLILSVKKNNPLDNLGVDSKVRWVRMIYLARRQFRQIFDQYFTGPEAGLMRAMMLGDRTNIPYFVNDLFIKTGTAHILAISGFNIGIIAGIFWVILKCFPLHRYISTVIIIFLLIVYMIMTGLRPSVIRATITVIVFLIAFVIERPKDMLNTTSVAANILLLINPLLLFDAGFQLSFLCVVALIVIYPYCSKGLEKIFGLPKQRLLFWMQESLAASLAVWFGVWPLIAYYFQTVSFISIVANLFITPLMTVVMFLGLGLMLSAFVSVYVTTCFAFCLKLVLNFTVAVVFLLAKCPGAFVYTREVNDWFVTGYYILTAVGGCLGFVIFQSLKKFRR